MSKNNKRDVIVVGAGVSGLAVARELVKADIDVLVVDRRQSVNAKSCMSGLIKLELIEEIFGKMPTGSNESLLQRRIIEKKAYCFQDNDSTMVNYKPTENEEQIFSVLKRDLCKYLVKSCQGKGCEFLFNSVVRNLIVQDGKIIGVQTDNEEYFADLVVIAEGPQMILAKSQGLSIGEISSNDVCIFAEEYIELPVNKVNKLFNVDGYSGLAMKFFTSFDGLRGLGYLNLNKHGFSIGVGIPLKESIEKRINVNSYLQKLKSHDVLCGFFKEDLRSSGYYSYVLPMPRAFEIMQVRLVANGCVIIGGAAAMMNMFDWDLTYLPLMSAKCAAKAAISFKDLKDLKLSKYENEVRKHLFEERLIHASEYNNGQAVLLNAYTNMSDAKVYDDLNSYVANKGKSDVED